MMRLLKRLIARLLRIDTHYESEQERRLIEWAKEYGGQARMRSGR